MDVNIKDFSLFWMLACSATLSAQAIAGSAVHIEQETASVHIANAGSRAAYLRAIKSRLTTPAAKVGNLYRGPFCMPDGDMLWDETLFRNLSYRLPKIFRRELQLARYPVPALYEANLDYDEKGTSARYLEIDISIERASAEVCMQDAGLSGWASMRVHWQVYYAGIPTSLHEAVTEGVYHSAMIENTTINLLFEKAFSIAAKNFLAHGGFYRAVEHASQH